MRLAGYPDTKTGSKSQHCQAWCAKVGTTFPLDQHFSCQCVCVWGGRVNDRRGNGVLFLCSLWMSPAERLAVPSCVSLTVCLSHEPFGHARWGRGCTWADWQQVSQQVPRRSCPAPAPFPTGRGPIHRLLRSQPARRLNQNQLFSSLSYCLLSPAAIVEGCLFLAICSWISLLRWASQGLPGQPQSQYCYPSTFSGPSTGPSRGFFIRFLPDVES